MTIPVSRALGATAICWLVASACAPPYEETRALAEVVAETPLSPIAARHLSVGRDGELTLSRGAAVDLLVELPAKARLEIERVEPTRGARLEIDLVCADGGARRELDRVETPGALVRELRPARAKTLPCALELRVPPTAGGAEAGVRLRGAHLVRHWKAPQVRHPEHERLATKPNIVLFLVDTLRADRLTPYGAPEVIAPAMEQLAREGITIAHGRAQSSWTLPTVATLMTGLTPPQHGAERVGRNLPADVVTLAERLREHGYRTGAVSTNPNISNPRGFAQGFEQFDDVGRSRHARDWATWDRALPQALAFLDTVGEEEPFFLYFHILEPHRPYSPPSPFRQRFAADVDPQLGTYGELERRRRRDLPWTDDERDGMTRLYDAEVASADQGLAALLAELERRGRLDDSVLLLTSDHGEELLEHGGLDHGHTLYEEQLRVPMIWRLPTGPRGLRVESVMDQVDVAPTLLELVGLPVPREMPGRSFAATLAGAPPPRERPSPAWLARRQKLLDAVAYKEHKLKRAYRRNRGEEPRLRMLFHLAADPLEQRNLVGQRPIRRRFLAAQLHRWTLLGSPTSGPEEAVLDAEAQAELAALGYL